MQKTLNLEEVYREILLRFGRGRTGKRDIPQQSFLVDNVTGWIETNHPTVYIRIQRRKNASVPSGELEFRIGLRTAGCPPYQAKLRCTVD